MKRRTLLTVLVALILGAMGMQAASNYGINVGGKEVNTDNYSNVTGGDIASGSVSYNPSTKVLTLTNVSIARTGGDNYGVHNRSVDGLTIRFAGTNNIQSDKANALHLDKATTVEFLSGSTTNLKMTAGENSYRGVVYVNGVAATFKGPGTLNIEGTWKLGTSWLGHCPVGFEGTGMSSGSTLTFSNINVLIDMDYLGGIYNFKTVTLNSGTDLKIFSLPADGSVSISNVQNFNLNGNVACVTPADDTFDTSNHSFTYNRGYWHFTDNYGVIFSTANFPDANFRNYLRTLCSSSHTYDSGDYKEQYLTPAELQNLTSLNVSGKSISNLTGVGKLTYLKTLNCGSNNLSSLPALPSGLTSLNCSYNTFSSSLPTLPSGLTSLTCSSCNLSSLPALPSTLTYLNCGVNKLTSLPTLPSGIQYVYAGSNKFTSLTVTYKSSLKELAVDGNTSLTSLSVYANSNLTSLTYSGCTALKSLTCDDNKLSTLGALPSTVTTFSCNGNQLTSLPTLPSGLTSLSCSNNQLTSLPSTMPSALTYLDCRNNQLTSLPLPSGIQNVYAGNNKFTTLTIPRKDYLKTLDLSNCTSLTELTSYGGALTTLNVAGCTSLKNLVCIDAQLTSLGTLPGSITYLSCFNNKLTSLPTLPGGLTELNCSKNQLTSLPSLPSTIQRIYASDNKFTSLSISSLPKLIYLELNNNTLLNLLHCPDNALITLSYSGCTALKTIDCYNNKLTSLGALPSTVTYLDCSMNQLTALPTLPSGLGELICSGNKLTSLTSLPSNLRNLTCIGNQLTILSVMGLSKLEMLHCQNNKLTSLSVQGCSSLEWIQCYRNQIKGSEMTTLVNSLCTIPENTQGWLNVLFDSGEGNEMTAEQVTIARNKNWIPRKYNGSEWVEITNTPEGLMGDVNNDGKVDVTDVNIVINIMLGKADASDYPGSADCNGDHKVDVTDVNIVINVMLGKQ